MSALEKHLRGDCWWPCAYCAAEEAHDDATTDDVEDDGSDTND